MLSLKSVFIVTKEAFFINLAWSPLVTYKTDNLVSQIKKEHSPFLIVVSMTE